MKIEAIKRVNISDEVSNQIQKLILEGYIEPEQKLPSERELCDEFNVSRTSVREALKGLISAGFLEKKSDGTYVNKNLTDIVKKPMKLLLFSKDLTVAEIYEARQVLETQNARLAAKKATEENLKQMENCVEIMENPSSSIENIMDSSVKFHYSIARATENKILLDVYQVIYDILQDMRKQSDVISNIKESVIYHRKIFDSIKARDEKTAEKLMYEHITMLFKNSTN